jgi:hypothetical protein
VGPSLRVVFEVLTLTGYRTHSDLIEYWEDEWQDLFDDVDVGERGRLQETFKDQTSLGESERAIAGDHQGREVIELLQNARDAIEKSDDDGRVYVGVCEDGLLVANTGDPFDFYKKKVERSATGIGKTSKGAGGTIGHKGVGLKSVLARGDAFEVWTRATDPQEDERSLRVRFSRAYLTATVFSHLGISYEYEDSLTGFATDFDLPDSSETPAKEPAELDEPDSAEIGDLPLFRYPVPLSTDARLTPIARLAGELVDGISNDDPGEGPFVEERLRGEFQTAVFIEYKDPEWRGLLESMEYTPDHLSAPANPDDTWARIVGEQGHRGIGAETLVQLEQIDEVVIDPVFDTDGSRSRRRWDICRPDTNVISVANAAHERVYVDHSQGSATERREYDQFKSTTGDHETKLLVLRTVDGDLPPSQTLYPPYLYYPVENVDPVLPVCLHGRFEVTTNRQQLSENELSHNKKVFEEAIDLIADVAKATATAHLETGTAASALYPWILLPARPDETIVDKLNDGADPTNNPTTLLAWFRKATYERLASIECVPAVDGKTYVPDVESILVYWDPIVLEGLESVYTAYDQVETTPAEPESNDLVPPPTQRSLAIATDLVDQFDLSTRLEYILVDIHEERHTEASETDGVDDMVTDNWVRLLAEFLSRDQSDTHIDENPHIVCPAGAARKLLHATARLFAPPDSDRSVADRIESYESLNGVYLFPCRLGQGAEEDTAEDELLLVPVETRSSRTTSGGMKALSRTILWNTDAGESDLSPPPSSAGFSVYFMDRQVEGREGVARLLSTVGKRWGVRDHKDEQLEYYRSLLDSFATDTTSITTPVQAPTIGPGALAFIANSIEGFDGKEMELGVGGYFQLNVVADALDSQELRSQMRRRLRLRQSCLACASDDWSPVQIQNTAFSTAAQATLADEDDADWPVDDSRETSTARNEATPDVIDPNSELWERARTHDFLERDGAAADHAIATALSLFGVDVLPGINILASYSDAHPRTDRTVFHWDPRKWSTSNASSTVLKTRLDESVDYLTFLTGPGIHPAETGKHTSKGCQGRLQTGGDSRGAKLAGWIWLEEPDALTDEFLLSVLNRYAQALDDSLLWTGWYCDRDHTLRAWDETVPSFLNWQLRTRRWESLVDPPRNDIIRDRWDEHRQTLRYAVRASPDDRVSQLLPTIGPEDNPLSTVILDALSVKPISDLKAVEAADCLQKLQETLGPDDVSSDAQFQLRIPERLESHWRQTYTDLLQPIIDHLEKRDGDPVPGVEDLGLLTHLPIQNADTRLAVPITDILEAPDQDIRYLTDTSPKPWVENEVDRQGYRLLERPNSGAFSVLTQALDLEPVDADRPIIPTNELNIASDVLTRDLKQELHDRVDFIVAALEMTDETAIESKADDLRAAIDDLVIVQSLTREREAELFDARCRLHGSKDQPALAVNREHCGGNGEELRAGCAIGIALLFERIAKRDVIERALRQNPDDQLRREWRDRGFPIENVQDTLGNRAVHRLERRIASLDTLIGAIGHNPVERADELSDILDEPDPATVEWATQQFSTGTRGSRSKPESLSDTTADSIEAIASAYRSRIPDNLQPVPSWVVARAGEGYDSWCECIETTEQTSIETTKLIGWLDDNPQYITDVVLQGPIRDQWRRLAALIDRWHATDSDRFADEDWLTRELQAYGQLPAVNPADNITFGGESANQSSRHGSQSPTADGGTTARTLPRRWFYVASPEQLETDLLDPFIDYVERQTTGTEVRSIIEQFVVEGDLPTDTTTSGTKQRQREAFAGFKNQVTSLKTDEVLTDGTALVEDTAPVAASSGGGASGGGGTSYTGRGEQAEVYVMGQVLYRLQDWLTAGTPRSRLGTLLDEFSERYDAQLDSATPYKWHVQSRWNDELRPLFERGFDPSPYLDLSELSSTETELRNLPFIQLINVTQEQGPGFDVIDPFGPLSAPDYNSDGTLPFLPVEVKAVHDDRRFRFTTNEFRRCQAFVTAGIPYAIRLVEMPDADVQNWADQAKVVSEYLFGDHWLDPEQMLPGDENKTVSDAIAAHVRGGYLTLGPDQ